MKEKVLLINNELKGEKYIVSMNLDYEKNKLKHAYVNIYDIFSKI